MPEPANNQPLVLFRLDDQRYTMFLDAVERVVRAVAVTPVPEAPAFLLGLMNMAGQLLSVVSLRACLGLPDHPIRPEDQFVLARTSRLTMALAVDEVQGLSALDVRRTITPADVLPEGGGARHSGLGTPHRIRELAQYCFRNPSDYRALSIRRQAVQRRDNLRCPQGAPHDDRARAGCEESLLRSTGGIPEAKTMTATSGVES